MLSRVYAGLEWTYGTRRLHTRSPRIYSFLIRETTTRRCHDSQSLYRWKSVPYKNHIELKEETRVTVPCFFFPRVWYSESAEFLFTFVAKQRGASFSFTTAPTERANTIVKKIEEKGWKKNKRTRKACSLCIRPSDRQISQGTLYALRKARFVAQ